MFPFDSPVNTKKPKALWIFQEKSKRNFKEKWAKMKCCFVARHKRKRRGLGVRGSSLPKYILIKNFGRPFLSDSGQGLTFSLQFVYTFRTDWNFLTKFASSDPSFNRTILTLIYLKSEKYAHVQTAVSWHDEFETYIGDTF